MPERPSGYERVARDWHVEPKHTVSDGIAELIDALKQGQFADVDDNPNFYGNYEIDYPVS